jgi:hypothetical protein
MLVPFFTLAANSPSRQRAFRNLVVIHILLLAGAAWGLSRLEGTRKPVVHLGHVMLVTSLVRPASRQ